MAHAPDKLAGLLNKPNDNKNNNKYVNKLTPLLYIKAWVSILETEANNADQDQISHNFLTGI